MMPPLFQAIAVGMVVAAADTGLSQGAAVEGVLSAPGIEVSGAVVYLVPETEADLRPPDEPALIDQVNLRFAPAVLTVMAGTRVEFRNSDSILHNVFSPGRSGDGFDLGTYPRTDRRSHQFPKPGAYVILCHVHPEMVAYVVVVPTPYSAVVDRAGRFHIAEVPPGRYLVHVWHRRLKPYEQGVVVPDGAMLRLDLDLGRWRRAGR